MDFSSRQPVTTILRTCILAMAAHWLDAARCNNVQGMQEILSSGLLDPNYQDEVRHHL